VRRYLFGFVLLGLCACGGSTPSDPPKSSDQTLQRETSAGQLALQLERPEEAVARYQEALTRAQARDDLGAIGDLGYNLAVAELEANDPGRALDVARSTEQELQRRGAAPIPGLPLVEATALYRLGDLDEAQRLASKAAETGDKQAALRATFLGGLIADERGEQQKLLVAAKALEGAEDPSLQADAAELAARLALRQGDPNAARKAAANAAALRQQTIDYRGLARALALGGEAAKRAGDDKAAADLYLRAGRSAAKQGDKQAARSWLKEAVGLASDDTVRDAANKLLKETGS